MSDLVLGVDGGNTKTIALIARRDGTIIGAGRAGCADMYRHGESAAISEIAEAVRLALKSAGIRATKLAAGVFSLAGADWPEDFLFLHSELWNSGFGRTILIVNDAIGALRAGSPDGTGVSIVCGTGAATGARGADGQIWHSSFWQRTQGSEQLASRMLTAVYHAELGIEAPTSLSQRTLEIFDLPSVEAVLHQLTGRGQKPPEDYRGRLARALLEEASSDPVAKRIVTIHAKELTEYAVVACQRVGLMGRPCPLVLAGSVLKAPDSPLAAAIIDHVGAIAPEMQPIISQFEPVIGALLLAFESTGVVVDDAVVDRLEATLPPSSLFET